MRVFALGFVATLVAFGPAAGWAQQVPVSRVMFPRFSIELPAGSVLQDSREPTAGEHVRLIDVKPLAGIAYLEQPEVQVLWLAQTMSYDEFRGPFLDSIVSPLRPATRASSAK